MSKNGIIKTFEKGEVIFREGDRGRYAYLLEHGRIELFVENNNKSTKIGVIGPGEIFGEMAILNNIPRTGTAIAKEDCQVIEISKYQLKERIEESDDIVRYLIEVLIGRLRDSIRGYEDPTSIDDKSTSTLINLQHFKRTQQVVDKIKLEKMLKQAIEKDELGVQYQPIINFSDQKIAGFEALMRWNSPDKGAMRPDQFMGIAEQTSLIIPMGQWIIKKVCYDFARLKKKLKATDKYTEGLFVGINIAVKQFKDPKLFDVLNYSVKKYGLDPKEIKLEITERVLINGDFVFEWIRKARNLGYSVALDDFGTGYSSLSYLANLDVNNLKIDKSFVDKMVEDKKTYSIVKSIVRLARDLNMNIIAEGVEEKKEWAMLKKLGCTYMQGYLFSRPLSLTDIMVLMTEEEVKKAA